MKRLLVDVRPLRTSAAFRRTWVGYGLSGIGTQMTVFAVTLQVWTLTGSPAAVGAVGLTSAVPMVTFGLFGGSIVDAVDRRRLVTWTSTLLALCSVALAAQAFAGLRQLWLLYAITLVQGLLSSVSAPARRTFLTKLLPPEQVATGAALNMLAMHAAVTVGPAVAGLVAAAWGLKTCYVVDAVSFVAALYGIRSLPPMPPGEGAARPGLRAVSEGLRWVGGHRVVLGALLADVSATLLGMPIALFPAVNAAHFGGSPRTLGLFTSAVAVGGMLGSALSGPVGRVGRPGRAMLVAGGVWGAGLVVFGLAGNLWLVLAALVVAGVADVLSVVFRTALVQLETPDRLRGRVSAVEHAVGAGCPQLGNARGGLVAQLTSPTVSAVSGGLSVIAGALVIGAVFPALRRYRSPTAPEEPQPSSADTAVSTSATVL